MLIYSYHPHSSQFNNFWLTFFLLFPPPPPLFCSIGAQKIKQGCVKLRSLCEDRDQEGWVNIMMCISQFALASWKWLSTGSYLLCPSDDMDVYRILNIHSVFKHLNVKYYSTCLDKNSPLLCNVIYWLNFLYYSFF